jgi:hypothetical protein
LFKKSIELKIEFNFDALIKIISDTFEGTFIKRYVTEEGEELHCVK